MSSNVKIEVGETISLTPNLEPEKKKKVVKRRQRRNPKRKKSKQKMYFTEETQQAIVDWQNAETQRERDRIFTRHIYKPLLEISKSLINVYNLADYHERDEVAHDCATNLFETLNKFDSSKGHKAFSYFSVVARHWLISERKRKRKEQNRTVHYDNRNPQAEDTELNSSDMETMQDQQTTPPPDGYISNVEFTEAVSELWNEMRMDIEVDEELGSHEILILEACEEICDNAEHLELQSRNAMRTYILEYTGLTKKEMAASLKKLRELYGKNKEFVPIIEDFWAAS